MAPGWGAGSWGHPWDNWVAASTPGEDEVYGAQESHGGDEAPSALVGMTNRQDGHRVLPYVC